MAIFEIPLARSFELHMRKILYRVRFTFIPKNSLRERLYHIFRLYLSNLKRMGFRGSTLKLLSNLRNDLRGNVVEANTDHLYDMWIQEKEPDQEHITQQRAISEMMDPKPLISILTPVYNPNLQVLHEALDSVLAQTYGHWELCLVNGASTSPKVYETLLEYAGKDSRIRLKSLKQNLGISGNTNAALEMADGEFIALLDQDDRLAPFALYEVVNIITEDHRVDLIYSDYDLLTWDGSHRYQPLFKPGWSPEIMLSANYLTHLTVIRTDLVRNVGGFDPLMDGAQDWDLFLRVTERTNRIAHIAKVLYHWRVSENSTADNISAKPYASLAQLRAINNHLQRLDFQESESFFDDTGFIRIRWALAERRKVSIIIPTQGADPVLERCINSIINLTRYKNYEIIIVNNGESQPVSFPLFYNYFTDPRFKVIHFDRSFNYSAVNNFGAEHADGEFLLFLNNDTEVISPDWLDEMVMWSERQDVGATGAKLILPDGNIQHAGVIIGMTGFAGHIFAGSPENKWSIFGLAEWYRDYSAITAACLMMRKEIFKEIGGFDESFILCGSDVELCLRLRAAGLRIVYNPFARLTHLEGTSRQGVVPAQDFQTSYKHYLPLLESGDPYFNPNLSYWKLTPTIAWRDEPAPLKFVRDYLHTLE